MPGPQPSRRRTTPSRASRRPSKATSTRPTEPAPRFRFIGGKGGVGKTTCAAAIAVASARNGTPTLLISTDPAPSLGDALIHPLSFTPRAVSVGTGVLHAAEIDAPRALARWLAGRRDALAEIALRGTWLDREDVSRLLRLSLPGIDELAALLEIARAGRNSRFELIVVDTAPTGHTLRMLAMPETLRGLARVFDRMQAKYRVMVEALRGAYTPDGSDALIEEIDREGRELASLLRDPTLARVSWVTLPEPMAVEETAAAAAALSGSGIPLHDVIVNRVTPPPSTRCGWCDGRRVLERQALVRLRARLPGVPTIEVAARAVEPRGPAALGRIGTEIAAGKALRPGPRSGTNTPVWHAPAPAARNRGVTSLLAHAGARLLLFGGKGGVGKTTCAAAAALAFAAEAPRKPVLLLSTDPAHSLADVFGQAVSDSPERLRGGPANLRVREIDAVRQFDAIRARYAAGIDALFDRLGRGDSSAIHVDARHDRDVMQGLIDLAPPGIDELAAVIDVIDAVESDASETIVMDTAPTGHALRLLEMPALVHEWTKALMSILLKYQSVGGIEEFGPVLLKLSQGLGRLGTLLADADRTAFIVVTRAAALPREETISLMRRLRDLTIHVPVVIVNAVGRGTCRRCRWEAATEQRHLAGLTREIPRRTAVVIAPAELPPPQGPAALRRWHRGWHLPG